MKNHTYPPPPYSEPREDDSSEMDYNTTILACLIALIVLLTAVFLYLVMPPLITYIRQRRPEDPKRVAARYATIEGWLISKRVRAHDDQCRCRGGEPCLSSPPTLKQASSYDTMETAEESLSAVECPICMCDLSPGEIVSWSPSTACVHVYHHQCIKSWLLRHRNCPSCRHVFLPPDDMGERETGHQRLSRERHSQLVDARRQRIATTYCCAESGLVVLPPTSKRSALTSSKVKPGELIALRGDEAAGKAVQDGDAYLQQDHIDESESSFDPATTVVALGGDLVHDNETFRIHYESQVGLATT